MLPQLRLGAAGWLLHMWLPPPTPRCLLHQLQPVLHRSPGPIVAEQALVAPAPSCPPAAQLQAGPLPAAVPQLPPEQLLPWVHPARLLRPPMLLPPGELLLLQRLGWR